jgi:hypothetical protein
LRFSGNPQNFNILVQIIQTNTKNK